MPTHIINAETVVGNTDSNLGVFGWGTWARTRLAQAPAKNTNHNYQQLQRCW
jgi:hypothetical protein